MVTESYPMAALGIGVGLALVLIGWARRLPMAQARALLAMALAVVAAIYVGFALAGGASVQWILVELIGVAIFVPIAVLADRFWAILLAPGWALHTLWDVQLHTPETTPFVPAWYPAVCVGFDLVVAGYAVLILQRLSHGDAPGRRERQ